MVEAVDWGLADRLGSRLVGGGPQMSADEARTVVAELYYLAGEASPLVQKTTGLDAYLASEVQVVDRQQWVRSSIDGFRQITRPLVERLEQAGPVTWQIGARLTGAQIGFVMGFVGSKVLGQFEIFTPDDPRLLLVAPNIVEVERRLGVAPRDFRLWVCVHEQTHRIQFAAAPWLADHMTSEIHEYLRLSDMSLAQLAGRMASVVRALAGPSHPDGIVGALHGPEQQEVFDRLMAVMSLLEGHADYVMDEVGPQAIPTVHEIRELFGQHRADNAVGYNGLMRRLLGLDLKARQYEQGAAFVRAVVAESGMVGLNRVWEGPTMLPTRAEIENPQAWIDRV